MSDLVTSPLGNANALMRYDANKKSALVAYLLLLFVGATGAHRFYLGKVGSGMVMLGLFMLSLLLTVVAVGLLGLLAVAFWAFIDLFLVPGMVQDHNNRLITQLNAG